MRCLRSRGALAVFALAILGSPGVAPAGAGPEKSPFPRRNPIVEAVQKTKGAIVAVKVAPAKGGKDQVGSGVIIDRRGYIVTNRHVVGAAKSPRVQLHDGQILSAEVLCAEARWDLAVLRIRADKDLDYLPLAPTEDLMVGESVIAVGHPYGYQDTVSVGIISALGREIKMPTGDVLTDLIQTDASINPGNSGGPLLNINGELIGINCALREEAQGIAFAISAATLKSALGKLLSAERVAGVHHGLACKDKVLGETGDRQRVLVSAPLDETLRAGDEILAVAEHQVRSAFDVERSLWDARPGQTVHLKVRREGRVLLVALTLAAARHGAGSVAEGERTTETQPVAVPSARVIGVSR
jgi:serine protease Do